MSIIGSADGPTTIFLAGNIGEMGWLNLTGLIIVGLLLIPNIVYAVKFKGQKNLCKNKTMNVLEQIGRYASMFLMIFNIGIAEFGFSSVGAFLLYFIGNAVLMLMYWILWMLFFGRQKFWNQLLLAVIPTMIFLLSGITLRHVLLIVSAVIFGCGHIYVTWENTKGIE